MRSTSPRSNLGRIIVVLGCFGFCPASVVSFTTTYGPLPLFCAGPVVKQSASRFSSLASSSLFLSSSSSSSSSSSAMDEAPSTTSTAATTATSCAPLTTLKVLALHGSGGTAAEFPNRLEALNRALQQLASHNNDNNNNKQMLEITAVQAPFVKNDGFSWWTMPPGVRSFNAAEYTGFEDSAERVLDVWQSESESQSESVGGFDLVIGHSQGAILVGALLALKRIPYHPPLGYILNGVSFPNPYSCELEALAQQQQQQQRQQQQQEDAANDSSVFPPSILFLLGKRDQIAPNATGEKLRDLLGRGGFDVSSCYHEGGHGFPQGDADDEAMTTIVEWILRQKQQQQQQQ